MPEEIAVQPTSINDLKPKMQLEGTVTRTELYGAFVNVGLERDGMIHISRLGTKRVKKVTDRVQAGDKVKVWVVDVNPQEGRIGLTMVEPAAVDWDELKEGQIRTGRVIRIERYGAFVDLGAERPGLLHVREMGQYVREPSEVVKENEAVEVRILRLDRHKRQIDLSMDLGNEPAGDAVEEEPFLSPMEIAFNQAQQIKAVESRNRKGFKQGKGEDRDGMEDIFRRTLRPPTNTDSETIRG